MDCQVFLELFYSYFHRDWEKSILRLSRSSDREVKGLSESIMSGYHNLTASSIMPMQRKHLSIMEIGKVLFVTALT